MRPQFWLVALLLAATALPEERSLNLLRPADDLSLLQSFALMVRDSFAGLSGIEVAAFVREDRDGTLSVTRWPSHARLYVEQYVGGRPSGVVAIAHTHPRAWGNASSVDVETAMRSGLPVYVITPNRISVVDPSTGKCLEVAPPGWLEDAQHGLTVRRARRDNPRTDRVLSAGH